jgi:hypothetical protein
VEDLFFRFVSNQLSERSGSKRQFHGFELLLGFLRRFEVFLRGRKRLVAEPLLRRPNVDSCSQPAGGGCVAEAMQMPFRRLEAGAQAKCNFPDCRGKEERIPSYLAAVGSSSFFVWRLGISFPILTFPSKNAPSSIVMRGV